MMMGAAPAEDDSNRELRGILDFGGSRRILFSTIVSRASPIGDVDL
jgi:hypothetical protein